MLKNSLVHPEILEALAGAGHTGKVLIADGDYPVSSTKGNNTKVVHLNLSPGMIDAATVAKALLENMPFEAAAVMDVPGQRDEPEIWNEYRKLLKDNGVDCELEIIERFAFYNTVKSDDTVLIIQTGENRDYANLLLTIGSRF